MIHFHPSYHIGQKAAQTIYYAFEQAERIGFPLNTHVTISFGATKCNPLDAVRLFGELRRDYFTRWIKRKGYTPTAIHVFENVRFEQPIMTLDDDDNNHVHWALHIPKHIADEFEMRLRKWIENVTGGIVDEDAVIDINNENLDSLRGYLLKGTDERWAAVYGAEYKPQGLVVGGRRTGCTSNLSRSQRKLTDKALGVVRRIPYRPYPVPAYMQLPTPEVPLH